MKYKSSRPFNWFPEEVSSERLDGDSNPALKQLGDTYKVKGNSFYEKMMEDLIKHTKTTFTSKEDLVDQSLRFLSSKTWNKSMALSKLKNIKEQLT